MRSSMTVTAGIRESRGKNEARRLRASGQLPAVVYGAKKESVAITVDPKVIMKILHSGSGHNTIFTLDVDGREAPLAMLVDWQMEPVRETLLHVDFQRIDPAKKLRVSVPIATHGESRGVKQQGGLLELVTRSVEIECLPDEIPEHFDLDITELVIGQAIRAGELPLSGEMKLLSPAESVLVHVVTARGAVEAVAEAEATTPEPELTKKGKKEE
jgi:large subunit ribosomal protein L25